MAQLKVKQILDFVTRVADEVALAPVGTATVLAISDANMLAIDSAEAKDVVRAATAVTNIATAKSEAISSALSADSALSTSVSSAIATVDGRVTTLLNGSTAALDTFGEIKGFIDSLASADVTVFDAISTAVSNDVVHTRDIDSINSTISGFGDIVDSDAADFDPAGSANTAELNAKAHADSVRTDFGLADTAVISAYLAADVIIEGTVTTLAGRVTTNEGDIAAIDTAIAANAAAIERLEGVIMEDNEERVESFTGNGLTYELDFRVQDDNPLLVEAFVNGHRINVGDVTMTRVDLANPGYTIDEGDLVVITYQSSGVIVDINDNAPAAPDEAGL